MLPQTPLSSAFSHYADLSVSEKLTESFKIICHHQPRGSDSASRVCVTPSWTTRLTGADICIWRQENVDFAGFVPCKYWAKGQVNDKIAATS